MTIRVLKADNNIMEEYSVYKDICVYDYVVSILVECSTNQALYTSFVSKTITINRYYGKYFKYEVFVYTYEYIDFLIEVL